MVLVSWACAGGVCASVSGGLFINQFSPTRQDLGSSAHKEISHKADFVLLRRFTHRHALHEHHVWSPALEPHVVLLPSHTPHHFSVMVEEVGRFWKEFFRILAKEFYVAMRYPGDPLPSSRQSHPQGLGRTWCMGFVAGENVQFCLGGRACAGCCASARPYDLRACPAQVSHPLLNMTH